MFSDNFFKKVENKTNVNKNTIMQLANKLQNSNMNDEKTIKESIERTKKVITIEDNTIMGGLATAVNKVIVENKIKDVQIQNYAYPDKFIEHGSVQELEKLYGIKEKDVEAIINEKEYVINFIDYNENNDELDDLDDLSFA